MACKCIPDFQDIEFTINLYDNNAQKLSPRNISWSVEIFGYNKKNIKIKYTNNVLENLGEIESNTVIYDDCVKIFAKSSKTGFGKGELKSQTIIYLPNSNFGDNVQVVRICEIIGKIV